MFLLKKDPPGISFSPNGPQLGNQGGVNFTSCLWKVIMKIEAKSHTNGFLINPTTILFHLSVQSGIRGVSISITLISKYGIMTNMIKVYNPAWQDWARAKNGKKCKKVKRTKIPPGELGSGLERAYSKWFFIIIKGYNIRKLIFTLVLVIWDPKAYNKLKKKHSGGGSLWEASVCPRVEKLEEYPSLFV